MTINSINTADKETIIDTIIPMQSPEVTAAQIVLEIHKKNLMDFVYGFDSSSPSDIFIFAPNTVCLISDIADAAETALSGKVFSLRPLFEHLQLSEKEMEEFFKMCAKCMVEELEAENFNFEEKLSDFYTVNDCWFTTKECLYKACIERLEINPSSPILQKMVMFFKQFSKNRTYSTSS